MNGHVSLAVSISREDLSNLKRIEMEMEKSSVKPIIGEGINKKYTILSFVCWLVLAVCKFS